MKFTINVVQTVEVELDESKFTDEYMKTFSEYMWQVDGLKDIAEYVARHKALYDGYQCEFVSDDMYKAEIIDDYTEEDY